MCLNMALAYIDREYEYAEIQEQVHALILDEMKSSQRPRSHYLGHLPAVPPPFVGSKLLQV